MQEEKQDILTGSRLQLLFLIYKLSGYSQKLVNFGQLQRINLQLHKIPLSGYGQVNYVKQNDPICQESLIPTVEMTLETVQVKVIG